MKGVPSRFDGQLARKLNAGQNVVIAMPELLDAAEFLAVVQPHRTPELIESLDRLRMIIIKLPAKIGQCDFGFFKSIMRRIDAPRGVARPRHITCSVSRPAA